PCARPPRANNESLNNSQVLEITLDGGGKVAPARRQSNSQISNAAAITTIGGTTFAAKMRALLTSTGSRDGRFAGASGNIWAATEETGCAGSVFITGICM